MRKYFQLIVVLIIFFSLVLFRHLRGPEDEPSRGESLANSAGPQSSPPVSDVAPTLPTVTAADTPLAPPVEATPTPTPTPLPAPTGKRPSLFSTDVFRDGEAIGKPERTRYGDLQIRVVMQSGEVVDVKVLMAPDFTPTSENITKKYIPQLIAEAIAEHDWDVDIISGATMTVQAFQRAMVYAIRASCDKNCT